MSRGVLFNPKLTPCQVQQFPSRRNFSILIMFQTSQEKKVAAAPWLFNFAKLFSKYVKIRTKSHKHDRPIGCRITVVKVMMWAGEPQPDMVKDQKIFTKDLLRVTLFFCQTLNFFNLVSIVL